ncbi:MAG: SLBB domain-containing protein [Armatimonadetes bacterium]|nr:SLBB domain-containing protein [Armatimonadota bacterium]
MIKVLQLSRCILLTALVIGMQAGAIAAESPSLYRLGPEDTVAVSIIGHPEFSGEYYIPNDGLLNLPGAGTIDAAGKTLDELADQLTKLLSARLRDPEVTVALRSPRIQRVYVMGAVKNPGTQELKPGWRITEAVAAAGGLDDEIDPAECKAIILRTRTGTRQTVDFADVVRGSGASNLLLESGDVLTIDQGEMISVYVMGQVKNPGAYKLRRQDAGVLEALALAGGVLGDAAVSGVTVTCLSGRSRVVDLTPALVGGKQAEKVALQSGDLVVVPETTLRVAVLGFVKNPGVYPFPDGHVMTLADAVGLAGGVDIRRGGASAAVIRTENGKQERTVFDLRGFLKKGDVSQNPEIKPGDVVYVPETSRPDWDVIMRSVASLGIFVGPFAR